LGDEQVAELKEAFELFDTARQGVLKKDTLKNTLKQFGNATNYSNQQITLELKGKNRPWSGRRAALK
jgi:Ca2+-binding EF-hand superfamily protein